MCMPSHGSTKSFPPGPHQTLGVRFEIVQTPGKWVSSNTFPQSYESYPEILLLQNTSILLVKGFWSILVLHVWSSLLSWRFQGVPSSWICVCTDCWIEYIQGQLFSLPGSDREREQITGGRKISKCMRELELQTWWDGWIQGRMDVCSSLVG